MAKTIADYKKDYEEARKNGDSAGMQAANDGANAIRREQGLSEEKATQDIANIASKNSGTSSKYSSSSSGSSSYGSNRYDDDDDGGSSGTSSSGSYDPTKPQGAQYNGPYGSTPIRPLDRNYYQKEAYYKSKYDAARANGDIKGMREANDGMNQVRNDYGLAAQIANSDIEYMKGQVGYYNPTYGKGGGGGSSGSSLSYGNVSVDDIPWVGDTQLSAPQDLSQYLEDLYAAQKNAAISNIKSAYDKNLNAINESAIGVDSRYQDARNQTAGASELAKRNFAEFAAATGLNSGAGGQAELSRNVTLQNNLNSLNQDEANFYSNIELQKAQAETDYNNAIAQAEANNDYAQAQALYQEKVRVQESLRQQELQQMQLDMQKYQFDQQQQLAQQQLAMQQQQYQDSVKAADRETLVNYGSAFLQQGIMPSDEMLAAMGLTANDAQSYINSLTKVSTEPVLTYAQMMDAISNGQLTPNVLSAYEYYMGAGYQPAQASTYSAPVSSSVSTAPARTSSTTSSKSTSSSGTVKSPSAPAPVLNNTPVVNTNTGNEWAGIDTSSVLNLGYGPISRDRLEALVDTGEVLSYQDPNTGLIVFQKAAKGPSMSIF